MEEDSFQEVFQKLSQHWISLKKLTYNLPPNKCQEPYILAKIVSAQTKDFKKTEKKFGLQSKN